MNNIKRKCIVTNQILDISKMIRVVRLKNGEFKVNSLVPGRGAYIINDSNFIDEIKRKKVLNKSFKTNVSSSIYKELEKIMKG
ncbi:YlxR family protein [Candidatus Mycoplasma mahonii]|uniref:YlxR family protein n=1 Tax=Candidatus Mycoplasma mahonii TaxID=3004105 RepID=UPI0026F11B2A|nr:YlxR family protein [Candidatus Mycoplasma mahonii]WKX02536.1 YlxR family protein [Candidatus Mycoplasma mahonii]